ncbi:MAG: hypothetical protein NTW06_04985 [Candidatus Falkowbacteria bacterium]|nr:hypothetical protein [Candidatus Falkowbacteria bacterium]
MLVMGMPLLDVAWTILRRWRAGKNPFKFADRQHLHFRLLELGLTQQQTVLVYCVFSTAFGLSALFLQTIGKILVFTALLILIASFIVFINHFKVKKDIN